MAENHVLNEEIDEEEQLATHDEMIEEAVRRLQMLGYCKAAIREFEHGTLEVSEGPMGALYWLHDDEKEEVRKVEERYGGICYAGVRNYTSLGEEELALLYVTAHKNMWKEEVEDIEKDGTVFAYVFNKDIPICSELGLIRVKPIPSGGLVRVF